MPLLIGTSVGFFVVYDLFIVHSVSFDLLKIFPYELSALSLMLILVAGILYHHRARIIQHKELLFILLFLTGFQTNAIQLSIIDLSDVTVGIFTLVLLQTALVNREQRFIRSPLVALNAIFLLCMIGSFIENVNPRTMLILVKSILLVFLMINFMRTKEFVVAAIKLFIIISTVSAMIGIVQEILYMYAGYLIVGSIPSESLAHMYEGAFLRVPAFMTSYGTLSKMLVISLIMIANILMYPNTYVKSTKSKLLLYFAFLLMVSSLILTFAQDAWIALAIGLFVSVVIRWRSLFIHLIILLLLLIIVCYYAGFIDSSVAFVSSELSHGDASGRIILDREGLDGFFHADSHNVLFGTGAGNGARYTSHYEGWPAHNAFILAANEIGLLGFLSYLALYIFAAIRVLSAHAVAREPGDKALTAGLLGGFIAITVMFQFYAGYIDLILWFYIGLIESTFLILKKETNESSKVVPNYV
jgi:O-antigen ligase